MFHLEEIKSCLICKRQSSNIDLIYENSRKQNLLIVCPYCGMYILPENWRGYSYISELDSKLKTKLKYNLKINEMDYSQSITEDQFQQKIRKSGEIYLKMPNFFSQRQIRVFGYRPPKFNNKQDILNYINTRKDYPESTNEKLNNLLVYFYNNGGIDGKHISIPEKDYSTLSIETSILLQKFAINLKERKLLEVILIENGFDSGCLSINGQIFVEDLLSKKTHNSKLKFSTSDDLNSKLINETRNILHKHPKAEKLFNTALDKYSKGVYERNLLDDMRLALELFLKSVLDNSKSLENQKSAIGKFQKEKDASPELSNMFIKLVDYYAKYHNSNIKHNDNVKKNEIGLLINLTSSFIMYFN
jgi:DNA-directed RNA polymerase subunit RPC12/RpoP